MSNGTAHDRSPTIDDSYDTHRSTLALSSPKQSPTTKPESTLDDGPSTKDRFLAIPTAIKSKTKDALHHNKDSSGKDGHSGSPTSPKRSSKTLQFDDPDSPSKSQKLQSKLSSLTDPIAHPRRTIRRKARQAAASNLSSAHTSGLSRDADIKLLEAYDDLSHAESSASSRSLTEDDSDYDEEAAARENEKAEEFRERVQRLEAAREEMRVQWTTDHIRRVRVVPKNFVKLQRMPDLPRAEGEGASKKDWLGYLGNVLLYLSQNFSAQYIEEFDELPYDLDALRMCIERVVMASAPWQRWLLNVRAVYRWENPALTGKWFALWTVLWYTEHIMAFLWSYIIFIVVRNRFYPNSVQNLRESVDRARQSEGMAMEIGELINKHGPDNWLKPLYIELGPHVQLQLGDVADMLEVFMNFYDWRSPLKTMSTLSFIFSCLMISVLADMDFAMKIFWFIVGGAFFICWPVASLYPKYRFLVSPFKWILWDIPTHAEWSFQYLWRSGQLKKKEVEKRKLEESRTSTAGKGATSTSRPKFHLIKTTSQDGKALLGPHTSESSSDSDDPGRDIDSDDWQSATSSVSSLSSFPITPTPFPPFSSEDTISTYRATYAGTLGKVSLTPNTIRFTNSISGKALWTLPYTDLAEMQKLAGSKTKRLATFGVLPADQLRLQSRTGESFLLENVRRRNEAFNEVIGLSGLRWQVLQMEKGGSGGVTSQD
ncbi:hypothetical protein MMC25_004360 [Agyrium rufum]|nr:hypothetical protein [Agyrium rufum]